MAPAAAPGGFGAWLTRTLGSIPYLVSGIEQIHSEASGATKKQLALDSLGLAINVTGAIDPALDPALVAATSLISSTIDGVKAVYNAAKNKPAAPAAPAPVAVIAPGAEGNGSAASQ
jgi:hypothetical protein